MNTVPKHFGIFIACLLLTGLLGVPAAFAHEARPAYLELKENAPNEFSVLWRTPVLAGMRLPILLKLPDDSKNLKEPTVQELADSPHVGRHPRESHRGRLQQRLRETLLAREKPKEIKR